MDYGTTLSGGNVTQVTKLTADQDGYFWAVPSLDPKVPDFVGWITRSQGFPEATPIRPVFHSGSEAGARRMLADYRKIRPFPQEVLPVVRTTKIVSGPPPEERQTSLWFVDSITGDVNRIPPASGNKRMKTFASESEAVNFANGIRKISGRSLLVAAGRTYPVEAGNVSTTPPPVVQSLPSIPVIVGTSAALPTPVVSTPMKVAVESSKISTPIPAPAVQTIAPPVVSSTAPVPVVPPATDKPVDVGKNSLLFLAVAAGLIFFAMKSRPRR